MATSLFRRRFIHPPVSRKVILAAALTLTTASTLYLSRDKFMTAVHASAPPLQIHKTFGSFGFRTLKLEAIKPLSHDTSRFRFSLPSDDHVSGLKLTSALLSVSWPSGLWLPVLRPYTPVSDLNEPGHVDLMVKHYPAGKQSSHIHSLQPEETLTFFGMALPGYSWVPNKHAQVLLIAGGAGITPIYQLAKGILSNPDDKTKVTLVWGVNGDRDAFLFEEFRELEEKLPGRFSVHVTVTKPDEGSRFRSGRVTEEFLGQVMKERGFRVSEGGMVFLCGPPPMEEAIAGSRKVEGVLTRLGIEKANLHRF